MSAKDLFENICKLAIGLSAFVRLDLSS